MIRVYFYKSAENIKKPSALFKRFVQVIENLGFKVLIDTEKKKANLDKADVFIVEVSDPGPQVGYVVAYAVSRRKPVFCLYLPKIKPEELAYLSQGISEKLIKIQKYTPEILHVILEGYLRQKQNKEISTTKFTLRVPASFVEFLSWKKKQSGRSKASIIRDEFVDRVIERDKDFQKYLIQKRKSE